MIFGVLLSRVVDIKMETNLKNEIWTFDIPFVYAFCTNRKVGGLVSV